MLLESTIMLITKDQLTWYVVLRLGGYHLIQDQGVGCLVWLPNISREYRRSEGVKRQ